MNFILTLLALGLVIFIHEMGHLVAAKRSGIGVYEFAVGMGPKVFSRFYKGTEYSLRLFPFGGFVRLAGMDDPDGDTPFFDADKHYQNKPVLARFITISAGSVMNILLGFTIFVCVYSFLGVPSPTNTIASVLDGTPAEMVGLQSGDRIIAVNSVPVVDVEDDVIRVIHKSLDQAISLEFVRDSRRYTRKIIPQSLDGNSNQGLIGVQFDVELNRYNPIMAIGFGVQKTIDSVKQVFHSLGMLINKEASFKDMAGPIGIVQLASFELGRGLLNFFNIMALISISLGVINLFPFPVLDGGHLVFLIIEAIIRRPLDKRVEGYLNQAGALVLILLMAFIVFNDVSHWQTRVDFLNNLKRL